MGPNKAVHLMYLGGGLLAFLILNLTIDWIWGYFVKAPNDLVVSGVAAAVALVAGIALYRNERVHGLALDVATELQKVTWPTKAETQAATIVVIVTVIIAAIILGTFDAFWSAVTDTIYG